MELKGIWSDVGTYDVGDIVVYTPTKTVHCLIEPCKAGTTPIDTRYWGKMDQVASDAILRVVEANSALAEFVMSQIPDNIDGTSIVLKSSTPDSDKEFLITVDDDGDLTATEITD